MSANINYENIQIRIRNNAISTNAEVKIISNDHLINLISHIIINLNTASRFQAENDIIFLIVKKIFPTTDTKFRSFNISIAMRNRETNKLDFTALISVVSILDEDTESIINFYNLFVNTLYSRLEQKMQKISSALNSYNPYLCDDEKSKQRNKEKQNILINKFNLYSNVLNTAKTYIQSNVLNTTSAI